MAKKLEICESVTPETEGVTISKDKKQLALNKLKELMREEAKLVRGTFRCYDDAPGAIKKITYKKYPTPQEMRKRGTDGGVEPFSKEMIDGQDYEIPLYVARFLNGVDKSAGVLGDQGTNFKIGTCSYGIHGFKMSHQNDLQPSHLGAGPKGESGIPVPIVGVTKRINRYGFTSLEFSSAMGE